MFSYNDDYEMKVKAVRLSKSAKSPLEKLKSQLMLRGVSGVVSYVRSFRVISENGKLNYQDFKDGMRNFGVTLTVDQLKSLFNQFDVDRSGYIDLDEFMLKTTPKMNEFRKCLIRKAFDKLDRDRDGQITLQDIKKTYNFDKNPKIKNGDLTEEMFMKQFMQSFSKKTLSQDPKLTYNDFENYYAGISSFIDNDLYFDLLMRNAWNLD
ncbi:MAG: hypothetical protein MHPSP_002777 [Paramarteilia canceri]